MYWVAVALVDSLLTAMVRANGDALVMHVGEKPIVVSGSKTIDLSANGLNFGAMIGMPANTGLTSTREKEFQRRSA